MPERDAKVFEMLLGQVGKNGNIDLIFGKTLSVLGHPEFFEPLRNLLHGGHQRSRHGMTKFSITAAYTNMLAPTRPAASLARPSEDSF